MTVKELVEYLQDCNQDLPVAICTDDFYGYYSEVSIQDVYADTVQTSNRNKFDAMVIRIV